MWQWIKDFISDVKTNRKLRKDLYQQAKSTIEDLKAKREFNNALAKRLGCELEDIVPEKLDPKKIAKMTEKMQKIDLFDVSKFKEYRDQVISRNQILESDPPEGEIYSSMICRTTEVDEFATTLDGCPYVICEDDLELLSKKELAAFETLTKAMLDRKLAALGR